MGGFVAKSTSVSQGERETDEGYVSRRRTRVFREVPSGRENTTRFYRVESDAYEGDVVERGRREGEVVANTGCRI